MTRGISVWRMPSAIPPISRDDVHVWQAGLDRARRHLSKFVVTLTEEERQRASRFHFRQDSERFIAGRGILRAILSRYLDVDPGRIELHYTAKGKPEMTSSGLGTPLRFNVAHTQGFALYAVTKERDIGIDVERLRFVSGRDKIAERFFSGRECAQLTALPDRERQLAFFRCWTRKEAYLKATGLGLSDALDQVEVSLLPGELPRVLRAGENPDEASRWLLCDLALGPRYMGSLAVEGTGWRLSCWQWREHISST